MLGVGRHQARRILIASGLPHRLITRRWRHALNGAWYARAALAISPEVADRLVWERLARQRQQLDRTVKWLEARLAAGRRRWANGAPR